MAAEPLELMDADEAEAIANELIPDYHSHLLDASIRFVFTNKERKKCDRVRPASAQKVSPLVRYLASGENADPDDGPDFVILISAKDWDRFDAAQKRALVDHELCHCGQSAKGDWKIIGHDLEEFTAVVERHGLWKRDVQVFAKAAAEQLKLAV